MIPMLHYPFKILLVDDDKKLAKSYESHNFGLEKIICTSSKVAINLINNQKLFNYNLLDNISETHELNLKDNISKSSILKFSFENILKIAYDMNKYEKIGILITDYSMPDINGLELCNMIDDPSIKKILLTNKLDTKDAIKALNKKVIDCYLIKNDKKVLIKLQEHINQLTQEYFKELTIQALQHIYPDIISFLQEQEFIDLFAQIIDNKNITEYYIIDKNCSFFLKSKDDKKYILNIQNNSSLNEFYELYKNEKDLETLVNAVKDRKLIPHFGLDNEPETTEIENWLKYFSEAQSNKNFFWNLIEINK